MNTLLLGCGPMIDESALVIITLLLVIKPLLYFGFIQAFRFRVSRPIPMSFGKAVGLAVVRSILGLLVLVTGFGVLSSIGQSDLAAALSWVYLYGGRIAAWFIVGMFMAGLEGRRLVGWTISGTMINAALDGAIVFGVMSNWAGPAVIVGSIVLFIMALSIVGNRQSLRLRFSSSPYCGECNYDLHGNLSGRCPECGTVIPVADIMKSGMWKAESHELTAMS